MANVYWGVHSALDDGANPTVLMVGDSWFWYPKQNLASAIAEQKTDETLVAVGFCGAEAREWGDRFRRDIDFGFKTYAAGVKALMLSGGGNDVVGAEHFRKLLLADCSGAQAPADCFQPGQPGVMMSTIMLAYHEVIMRFRAYNKTAPVIMHNYDNAWPTGKGFFGPADWLREPMENARVPAILRRDLFKSLVNRLYNEQEQLSSNQALGTLMALRSSGTLPEDASWWDNELHPTPAGFDLLANRVFVPALRRIDAAAG
jgi:hypothetical protein